ncbi:hypothetical protein KCU64_g23364, partial [Aureobasidium melanogenum]
NKHENLTILTFWSALQLESDILAEWDYPRSGLHLLEGSVTYPGQLMAPAEQLSQEEQRERCVWRTIIFRRSSEACRASLAANR